MTLQTYEEREILHKIRQLDVKMDMLFALVREILKDVEPPKYKPTARIAVTPIHHGHHHHRHHHHHQ